MKIPYNTEYIPPAPTLKIALALRDEPPKIQDLEGLIDTGADATLIPTELIEKLDAPYQYAAMMRAFVSGSLRRVSIHTLDILIDGNRFPSIDVIADDEGEQIILGRNLLNKLRLVLDGPKGLTEL